MNPIALRATLAIASVYGYFLIFAQFSWIELLRAGGANGTGVNLAMTVMACAAIVAGFLVSRREPSTTAIRMALIAAATASALAPLATSMSAACAISLTAGAALGLATVGLAALLPAWCDARAIGLGTGIAYAFCNVPLVFDQPPAVQACVGAGLSLLGVLALPRTAVWKRSTEQITTPWWIVVMMFTALVWLDSAVFFIIQHVGEMKSATWSGSMLWRNSALHLASACLAGCWLMRQGTRWLPGLSWLLLAVAAILVNHPAARIWAGWLYPAGVSLYSTALVALPAMGTSVGGPQAAARRAAWIFAIAGWFGSANGIGMAQSLREVPLVFIVASGSIMVGVLAVHQRNVRRVGAVLAFVLISCIGLMGKRLPGKESPVDRGRQVYLAEGCIHCHSRYPRPGSADEWMWGPSPDPADVLSSEPVLIGNRRHGPDLANIGARRSETWLRLFLENPRALAPDSAMPSYGHLFRDGRGEDLVAFLRNSGLMVTGVRTPPPVTLRADGFPARADGASLFAKHCSMCHGACGLGDGILAARFLRPPANLVDGPFVWTAGPAYTRLAEIVRFGIPGTDMPGHETMGESEVDAIVHHVRNLRAPSR